MTVPLYFSFGCIIIKRHSAGTLLSPSHAILSTIVQVLYNCLGTKAIP